VSVTERIEINGQEVSDSTLAGAVEFVDERVSANGLNDCSQFEILFAAALMVFYAEKTDIAVIEAGIGGTLDCTNVITPQVSVITSIGYDHIPLLVNPEIDIPPLYQIALQKSGIIKPNIPLVATPHADREIANIFAQISMQNHSRFYFPEFNGNTDYKTSLFGNEFVYEGEKYNTKMGGLRQIYNAVTAIKALWVLGVRYDCVKRAIEQTVIPARLQVVSQSPLIVLDGAHNEDGLQAAFELFNACTPRKRAVITGFSRLKDVSSNARAVLDGVQLSRLFVVTDFDPNALGEREVRAIFNLENKGRAVYAEYITVADIKRVFAENKGHAFLVTGSLYLAGKVIPLL
jgi:dihydrofolate synthase/folylpolyglutamate synthase